jgi:ribosomal protein S18 acetylase RimI-like enzyme
MAELIEIRMVRPDLRDLPQVPVPAPYRLRRYRPGDIDTWVRVQQAAEKYHADVSRALFLREFGEDHALLAERQLFAEDEAGEPVGTATAWFDPADRSWGRIHWVAVVPAAQGRGLGKALVSALCQRFVELHHTRAYLTTETVRVPAIRMYRGFGFR